MKVRLFLKGLGALFQHLFLMAIGIVVMGLGIGTPTEGILPLPTSKSKGEKSEDAPESKPPIS